MSNNFAVGSRVLLRIFLSVLITVSGLVSCGGGGGSTTTSTTLTALPTFTIAASAGNGGTITPSGTTTVNQGTSQNYTITPDTGYIIAALLIDGNSVAASTTYTFTNVQADHTISATFGSVPTYTITASAGPNGTVTPLGVTAVTQGNSQSYSFAPNPGYIVATHLVDGISILTSATTRTFTNVQANHSISATFSAAPTGSIAPSLVPARTSGVAPLAVFFDASATTDTGVTTRPFHELEYTWDFGDPGAGTWAYGAQPGVSGKNSATGPVSAHVFETPGTYTVTLTVFDGTNTATRNTTITVQDPTTVFAGTNTICVSSNTMPTSGANGCPTGAAVAQEVSFPTIISTYAITGRRVLLKRGDTFTGATEARLSQTGPGIVGAYGTGNKPVILSTGALDLNSLSFSTGRSTTWSDWRVMDLSFNGQNRYSLAPNRGNGGVTGIGLGSNGGGTIQATILRVSFKGYSTSLGIAIDGLNWVNNRDNVNQAVDQLAVVECDVNLDGTDTTAGITAYNSGNRIAFLGNYFDGGGLQHRYDHLGAEILNQDGSPSTGSHVTRFPYCYKCVISNNDIRRPGGTRHHIKLHAPYRRHSDGLPNNDNPDPEHGGGSSWSNYSPGANWSAYTEQVVISDNYLLSSEAPWDITVSPQDAGEDERVRDVILERNWHDGVTAGHQIAQVIRARQITSRNNIATEALNSDSSMIRVDIDGGEPPATDVWIYNNTYYKYGGLGTDHFGFSIVDMPNTRISNVTIKNNLGYAPTISGSVPYFNAGITGLTQSNNSTASQINTPNPSLFIGRTNPAGLTPRTGNYAINNGAPVPVWSDFFRNIRSQNGVIDIGAIESP